MSNVERAVHHRGELQVHFGLWAYVHLTVTMYSRKSDDVRYTALLISYIGWSR